MAGTNIVAGKVALMTALQALAVPAGSLEGVRVDYSYVGKHDDGTREYVYGGGTADAQVDAAAMKGSGRLKRTEDTDWSLTVKVFKPGEQTAEAAETRAAAIGTVIENYLAANPTLSVTGLILARIRGWSLTSTGDDDGTYAALTYSIAFESYLT